MACPESGGNPERNPDGRCLPTAPHGPRPHAGPPNSPGRERNVRIKRTTTSGITRRTRLIAISTGLVAAAAIAIPHANAADTTPFSAAELKSAGNSVLKADVPGTAWAVDSKT